MVTCWYEGCTVDIKKAENWTPVNKIWVNTSNDMPHDLKACYKRMMKKQGLWKEYNNEPVKRRRIPTSAERYEKIIFHDPILDNIDYYGELGQFLNKK